MEGRDSRTINLIGTDAMERLRSSSVIVIGCGGVGSYAAEAVARAGVGRLTFMDGDVVAPSNLNRQLVALISTMGMNKAEVMAQRASDINPDADVMPIPAFYKSKDDLHLPDYDWVIDAIDDVDAKVELIKNAVDDGVNIISAMGAAGKFDTNFKVTDLASTSTCPLARVMRRRLREIGIEHLPVVYSDEKPAAMDGELGTISYVPPSAGLCLAGYVIREIAGR